MLADALIQGHILLSDWLLLIAAIVFIVATVIAMARSPRPWVDWSGLVSLGLAATAIALLVV